METRVGRKVSGVGKYSVMRSGDRYYVLSPSAEEVGDCCSMEEAVVLAGFLAPEVAMARELEHAGKSNSQEWG